MKIYSIRRLETAPKSHKLLTLYATASASTWTIWCFQTANYFCTSFGPSNTISQQIQLSHHLLTSGKAPNAEPSTHIRGAVVAYWTSSCNIWPPVLPFPTAVVYTPPAARNVATPALCSSLCLLSRACHRARTVWLFITILPHIPHTRQALRKTLFTSRHLT